MVGWKVGEKLGWEEVVTQKYVVFKKATDKTITRYAYTLWKMYLIDIYIVIRIVTLKTTYIYVISSCFLV
jgi:hypothetical protein